MYLWELRGKRGWCHGADDESTIQAVLYQSGFSLNVLKRYRETLRLYKGGRLVREIQFS